MNQRAVKRLKMHVAATSEAAQDALMDARKKVAARIRAAAKDAKISRNEASRKKLFRELNWYYSMFAETVDDNISKAVRTIALEVHYEAEKESKTGAKLKFDRKRYDDYMAMITPENGEYLAGTYAGKHASDTIRGLRQATVETFRGAQLEGMTATEIHKNLQKRWDEIAGNLEDHRFVDASGRAWSNSHYLNMLTRTILQTVARESYIDTLVGLGDDLGMINAHGENCDTCKRWNGRIVSLSGTDKRFPSYRDALADGWAHPNCDCTLDAVIAGPDDAEIKKQAKK